MGSISYENYRELSKLLKKKVAVITDNDGKNLECYDNNLFKYFQSHQRIIGRWRYHFIMKT